MRGLIRAALPPSSLRHLSVLTHIHTEGAKKEHAVLYVVLALPLQQIKILWLTNSFFLTPLVTVTVLLVFPVFASGCDMICDMRHWSTDNRVSQ